MWLITNLGFLLPLLFAFGKSQYYPAPSASPVIIDDTYQGYNPEPGRRPPPVAPDFNPDEIHEKYKNRYPTPTIVRPTLPHKNYNYAFDFEKAVIEGLVPDPALTGEDSAYTITGLRSAPNCPPPFNNKPWVLYGNPARCHLATYQFPCPKNMKLRAQGSSFYGYCDCNCKEYSGPLPDNAPQSYCIGETSEGDQRILAYTKADKKCHPLFERGMCDEGDWLIFSQNVLDGPVCEERKCHIDEGSRDKKRFSFYDYQNQSCHVVGDKCTLHGNQQYGSPNFQLHQRRWTPTCAPASAAAAPGNLQNSGCPGGQQYSQKLKGCQPRKLTGDVR